MKLINPSFEILSQVDGQLILEHIERCGRICYLSEGKAVPGGAGKWVASKIKMGHESIIEHASVTCLIICDRGVTHEIVRHRIASYSQESTRYCNYGADGKEVTFIYPFWMDETTDNEWKWACGSAERAYLDMLAKGATPQEARSVLPNSLKTSIVVTMNLREWRHFFKLRACGTSGKPHPQMLQIAVPMLEEFKRLIPVIFDDLVPMNWEDYVSNYKQEQAVTSNAVKHSDDPYGHPLCNGYKPMPSSSGTSEYSKGCTDELYD